MAIITTQFEGPFVINTPTDDAELADIADYMREHIDQWVGKLVIWDVSAMGFATVTGDDFEKFAAEISADTSKRDGEKTAIVAPRDLQFGMTRMFETWADLAPVRIEFQVVRTIEEAKAWLLGEDP